MKLPAYSIITLTHSRPKYLGELLISLDQQTHLPERVVVVLNGKGQSTKILQAYRKLKRRKSPYSLLWLESPESNVPESFNLALEKIETDWIAPLGDDDLVTPLRFESQLTLIGQRRATLSAGAADFIDAEGNALSPQHPVSLYYENAWESTDPLRHYFLNNRIVASTQIFRTEDVRRVGGMNPRLLLTHDFDLTLKLMCPDNFCFDRERNTKYRVHSGGLFAENREAALIEMGYIINQLEADPSSILHQLLRANVSAAWRNLLTFPAYPYKFLSYVIAQRDGFAGRSQSNPIFHLIDERERELLTFALENTDRIVSAEYAKDLESDLTRVNLKLHALEESPAVQLSTALQDLKRQPSSAYKLPLLLAKFSIPPRLREGVNRWALRKQAESLPSAFKNLPRRLAWKVLASRRSETIENTHWPSDQPLVSVIVPCFNYGHFLPEAVRSVLEQTWKDVEVIIVEGGSTDEKTVGVVRQLEGGRVRCFYQESPSKVGENRLFGMKKVRGKYVVFLDADDSFEPTYLEKAVYVMETTGVDLVTPFVRLYGDKDLIRTALQTKDTDVWITWGIPLPEIFEANACSTAATFRYEFWRDQQIGYCLEAGLELEDWDFWLRFATAGARFRVISEPLHLHRLHGASLTDSLTKDYQSHVEKLKTKWRPIFSNRRNLFKSRIRQNERTLVRNPEINLDRWESGGNGSRKIQLLLAVPWLDVGGSSVLLSEVFTNLTKSNFEVTVVATTTELGNQAEGISLYAKYSQAIFNLNQFLDEKEKADFLLHLVRSRQPDLMLLVGSSLAYETLDEMRKAAPSMKVVDHLYNSVGHVQNNHKFRHAIDFNIVANDEVKDTLTRLGEDPARIRPILHGIDATHFSPENLAFRKAQKLDPWRDGLRRFTFGFLGRLSEEKAPEDILKLAKRIPEARFLFCGTGPMQSDLLGLAKNLEVEDRVRFLGRHANALEFYRSVDAIVIPSRVEGLPLVLLESMALGIPTLASEVGHIGKVIDPGINGFIFPSGDLEKLEASARKAMALSPEARLYLGRMARETVLQGYTLADCTRNYEATFLSLLDPVKIPSRARADIPLEGQPPRLD
jgi:glycosyltransferase involved in cell wall biosynthesis